PPLPLLPLRSPSSGLPNPGSISSPSLVGVKGRPSLAVARLLTRLFRLRSPVDTPSAASSTTGRPVASRRSVVAALEPCAALPDPELPDGEVAIVVRRVRSGE